MLFENMNDDEKKQTLEEFFSDLSLSLANSIIYSIHQKTKFQSPFPKAINFDGTSSNFLSLISDKVKENLGSENSIYSIPHVFCKEFSRGDMYHIDLGWFFSTYYKNGKVKFYNLSGQNI